jgi:hypothetical protein
MDKTIKYPCGCYFDSWSEGYVHTHFCVKHEKHDIAFDCGCEIHTYQPGSAHIKYCAKHADRKIRCPVCHTTGGTNEMVYKESSIVLDTERYECSRCGLRLWFSKL